MRSRPIDEFLEACSPEERGVFAVLASVDPAHVDAERSSLRRGADSLDLSLVAKHDLQCPFDLHLERPTNAGRLALFIGRGAEVLNWEASILQDAAYAAEVQATLDELLRATITVRRLTGRDERVLREDYSVAAWERQAIVPRWQSGVVWPWTPRNATTHVHRPWISA